MKYFTIALLCCASLTACWSSDERNIREKDIGINTNAFFDLKTVDADEKFEAAMIYDPIHHLPHTLLVMGEKTDKNKKIESVKTFFRLDPQGRVFIKNEPCGSLCVAVYGDAGFDTNGQFKAFSANEIIDDTGKVLLKAHGSIVPVKNSKNQVIGILNFGTPPNSPPNTVYTVSYQDLAGRTIKKLARCGNDDNYGLQYGTYHNERGQLVFFLVNFSAKLLCTETQEGETKQFHWPFRGIDITDAFKNNFLVFQPEETKENTVEAVLIDRSTLVPKKLFTYSKPDISWLGSDLNNFSDSTAFEGCDKQNYLAVNLQGIVARYPFSRVLIFKENGEMVFDMKSNRVIGIYTFQSSHSIVLVGHDGIRILKDKRC